MYCVKVFLSNMWSDDTKDTANQVELPIHSNSMRTTSNSAKLVYQRVKKILWLQWRSLGTVLFLLVDIVFFAVVWVQLDESVRKLEAGNMGHLTPFITCLVINMGKKDQCYKLGQDGLINESTSISVLVLLSLAGIQTGLLMTRTSFFVGWSDLFKRRFGKKGEFVSVDAKRYSAEPRNIELIKVNSPPRAPTADTMVSNTETWITKEEPSPPPAFENHAYGGYSPPQERRYMRPSASFSGPGVPTSQPNPRPSWDPTETFAAGSSNGRSAAYPPSRDRNASFDHNRI
jgi:hypothetical protein